MLKWEECSRSDMKTRSKHKNRRSQDENGRSKYENWKSRKKTGR